MIGLANENGSSCSVAHGLRPPAVFLRILQNQGRISADSVNKLIKTRMHGFARWIRVNVIPIHFSEQEVGWREVQEGSIVFIGFAGRDTSISEKGWFLDGGNAANEPSRTRDARLQQPGKNGGDSRLSVCACHSNGARCVTQLGEQLGAFNNGDTACGYGHQLWVRKRHRCCSHNKIRRLDEVTLADSYINASLLQHPSYRSTCSVTSSDKEPGLVQGKGQTAHTGAPDSREVNAFGQV